MAAAVFVISFTVRSLHAADLAPLMHTRGQPALGMTKEYDARALSILDGHGLLVPDDQDPADTSLLARDPGYSIFLSAVYRVAGRNYFAVQLVQDLLNSASPILIMLIAASLLGWRVGPVAGLLAALSHHLSYYSNFILPDSLCALPLLAAVYMLITTERRGRGYWPYAGAGALIGLAAWLRPNGMLMAVLVGAALVLMSRSRRPMVKRALVMVLVAFITILPITVRNYVIYRSFVPIQLGFGFALWQGIGEAGDNRYGGIRSDQELLAEEGAEDPRYGNFWASPDGIERDRARVRKAVRVIASHPLWYAGSALGRMASMFSYKAQAPLVYRSDQVSDVDNPLLIGRGLAWTRVALRTAQRVAKESATLMIVLGMALVAAADRRKFLYLFMVPLYYLLFQSLIHTEFRYTLPMHYFLFTFAAVAWVALFDAARALIGRYHLRRRAQ